MPDHVVDLTDAEFAGSIGKGVVLVDFYGTYCPPCKMLDPVVEELARRYGDRALIARINIDEHSEAAVDHTVEDIPTLVFFKDGEEAERLFGAQKLETLAGELDRLLS